MSRLLDIVTAPWAILPDKLLQIRAIYEARVSGEKADLPAIEAALGRSLQNEPQGYDVVNGVAVIPMFGVLAKRANLFSAISGGASTELIARDLRQAATDPRVGSILLHLDSPGGTVDGTQQLARLVRQIDAQKPVVGLADGVMASAAYWSGSPARALYIADATTQVGSIGVVATHADISAAEAARGVKTTEITAGKYKRIASQFGPLTEEGRVSMQDTVDYLYELFVNDVAAHRGVSVEQVLADMADGRVFIGQRAIDAGLADGMATLDELIARMADGEFSTTTASACIAVPMAVTTQPPTGATMNREELAAQHPELVTALLEEGRSAGAAAERERILGIEANALPGYGTLIAEMKADGKTTPDQAAGRIVKAENEARAKAHSSLHEEAPPPLPPAASTEPTGSAKQVSAADLSVRAAEIVNQAKASGREISYAAAVGQAQKEMQA